MPNIVQVKSNQIVWHRAKFLISAKRPAIVRWNGISIYTGFIWSTCQTDQWVGFSLCIRVLFFSNAHIAVTTHVNCESIYDSNEFDIFFSRLLMIEI